MFLDFIIFIVPALLWFILAKIWFHHHFQWQETAVQIFGAILIVAAALVINRSLVFSDIQIVHGNVTNTEAIKKDCNQYWSDQSDSFCTEEETRRVFSHTTCTTIDGKQSCTSHYKTQYRAIYPWEVKYFVNSDVGSWMIARVDRQGAVEPPRWLEAKVGDPVSNIISVENYIKASADTIVKRGKTEQDFKQDYPQIYDYYKTCTVFWIGVESEEDWCDAVARLNSDLKNHKINIVLTITDKAPDYAETLAREWHAHKINDFVVTIGVDENKQIKWVDVRSWSSSAAANIWPSNELMFIKDLDRDRILEIIEWSINSFYKQRSMEEFEYLKDDVSLSPTAIIIILILLGAFTVGSSIIFHREDFF